jgi:hypothetical protein
VGWVFAANAMLTALAAVAFWRYGPRGAERAVSAEHVTSAVVAGGRFVRFSPELRRVLWRTLLFMFGGSALWAMLPVVARGGLHLGSTGYGLLLACLGIGAVAVVPALTRLREAFAPDVVGALSAVAFALGTLALALTLPLGVTCVLLALAGAGWTSTLAVFNTGAQQVLAAWVRARALAALGVIGASVLAGTVRPLVRLAADPLPSDSWPDPLIVAAEPAPDDGPVLISIAYDVPPAERGVRGDGRAHRAGPPPRRRRLLAGVPRRRAPHPVPGGVRDALVGRAPAPAPACHARRRAARARAQPVARGGGAAPRRRPAAAATHLVGLCA